MIERVVSGCVTRGSRGRKRGCRPEPEMEEPRMSYTEFVWFLLAEEDKQHPTAIEYWFRYVKYYHQPFTIQCFLL